MKILHHKNNNNHSTQQLPKSHTFLFENQISPSKLNIKLKTHSLTSLDIPLETFVDFKQMSSSFRHDHQKTMVGSVDLNSEIQQQLNDESFSCFSSSIPLINIASSNKQLPSIQQEYRQNIKHRFRLSNSFLIPTLLNNSGVRLRRSDHLQNIHQSSLQTINKIPKQKHRLSLNHNGSIPKFSFRDLPSYSRQRSSVNQFEQSSDFGISPYISLPEIQSFVKQNSSKNTNIINNKSLTSNTSSFWKKSSSWSWKSNDALEIHSNIVNKQIPCQFDDHHHSHLPVIIESPLQKRSSLQTINQNDYNSSMKLTNIHHSNSSCHNNEIQLESHKLYQKTNIFPHSFSNYEISQDQLLPQSKNYYPSTPLLAYSRQKSNNKFDYHSYGFHMSPMAFFDDDNDSDSISRYSSFRSCLNSINDYSENHITDLSSSTLSSSSSGSYFQEILSNYQMKQDIFNETKKHTRLSIRHLCNIQ
ncbi:unnamed protein product [Rotaria sordida]|uniref:Uncharacterized protein n=1 Tax=Rotaria sordida TaxID=392033 RepID=A0A819J482_9BILA|nr:unnamed protein product [Rotaria sordida]CAF1505637.1 unnamed protein product [Rotaria sordida]CAF3880449.1 unnamed protein product [Rotaria sordida]CAF3924394.1 unnamed protein product [Rotaria sordida]